MAPRNKRNYDPDQAYELALEERNDLAVRLAEALATGNELRASELLRPYQEARETLQAYSIA